MATLIGTIDSPGCSGELRLRRLVDRQDLTTSEKLQAA